MKDKKRGAECECQAIPKKSIVFLPNWELLSIFAASQEEDTIMKIEEEKKDLLPATNPLICAIRRKMEEMNVNQKQAAKMLGLSESRLSDLLNGRRKVNLNIARKLRDNFGVSADFIFDNTDV